MTRDYSNSTGNRSGNRDGSGNGNPSASRTGNRGKTRAGGNRKRPRPATKRNTPKKNRRKQAGTPGWVWLASGLCIGMTVAAFAYIITRPTSHPGRDLTRVQVPQPVAQDDGNAAQNAKQPDTDATDDGQPAEPQFAFYEMLPDYEIVIPQQDYPEATGDTDGNHSTQQPAEPQPTTPTVRQPERYVIQAGSFSSRDDANRRRAQLALLGMQAHIVRHQFDSGRVVYRVRSHTIESNNRLTEMLKRLRAEGIGTLVLRRSP